MREKLSPRAAFVYDKFYKLSNGGRKKLRFEELRKLSKIEPYEFTRAIDELAEERYVRKQFWLFGKLKLITYVGDEYWDA